MDPLDAAVLQAVQEAGGGATEQTQNELAQRLKVNRDEIEISLGNLTRLNLMSRPQHFVISAFGREFLRAISD
jgi:predicted transcriptional regulator